MTIQVQRANRTRGAARGGRRARRGAVKVQTSASSLYICVPICTSPSCILSSHLPISSDPPTTIQTSQPPRPNLLIPHLHPLHLTDIQVAFRPKPSRIIRPNQFGAINRLIFQRGLDAPDRRLILILILALPLHILLKNTYGLPSASKLL
jgi:hypothetical protein